MSAPSNQPMTNAASAPPFDGVWLAVCCIAGAGVGGVLGSISPSLAGVVGCAVYLMRRSGRRVTPLGLAADVVALLTCALFAVWGLVDWYRLEQWGFLAGHPFASQFVAVLLVRAVLGLVAGLVVGAALGVFGRRPRRG
jgi:hypothetical protein